MQKLESNILKVKAVFCFVVMLLLSGKGFYEFFNSDAQAYRSNLESSLKRVSFTLSHIKCHEKIRTANRLDLVAKENKQSLFAYPGNKCMQIEQELNVGDYISVDALLEISNVKGIIKNGVWLMNTKESLDSNASKYRNYYLVYLVISMSFFFMFLNFYRKSKHI